jgi:CBS domain-containing protein
VRVSDVMARNAECIHPDATIREAARRMRDLDLDALMVYDGDELIGILTDRDIAVRAVSEGLDPKVLRVEDVMTPDVVYCYKDQDVAAAADLMDESGVYRLPVLERDGRLAGIVSMADLVVEIEDGALTGSAMA